ncbi:hypothetical protein LINPERPRIM_LOCUS2025 [Linum perenne]
MTIIPLLFVDINNEPMYIWQDKLLALLIVRKNPNLAKNCRAYLLFYKEIYIKDFMMLFIEGTLIHAVLVV